VTTDHDNSAAQVHWHEGMFLYPHHLQMSTRQKEVEDFQKIQACQSFWWGISEMKINKTALAGYRFKIDTARLRLKDGTWIHIPENAYAEEMSFEDLYEKGLDSMTVWVGVRRAEPYTPMVHELGKDNTGTVRTYVLRETNVWDDSTGDNKKTIQTRLWNVRVFVGSPPGDQYESMQIGDLSWSSSNRPEFSMDKSTPFLSIDASAFLSERLRNMIVRLNNQAAFLQKEMAARRIVLNTNPARVIENLLRLQISGSFGLTLKHLMAVGKIHPFQIYLELIRLAGNLVALSPEMPFLPPDYDHDNAGQVMNKLIRDIEGMIDGSVVVDYDDRAFEFLEGRHQCRLDREWLDNASDFNSAFYLCIVSDQSDDHVDKMLSHFNVKIGPPSRIQDIRRMRTQGMPCERIRRVPAGLPDRSGLHYYKLDFSRRSEFWEGLNQDLMLVIDGISVDDISGMNLYVYLRKDSE
jgi:type VI secretion system protein ImpJ